MSKLTTTPGVPGTVMSQTLAGPLAAVAVCWLQWYREGARAGGTYKVCDHGKTQELLL